MMMMDKKMCDLMCEQIANEMASANLYLNIAAYFDNESLVGFAYWMRKQAEEEYSHAMRFFDHMLERRGVPMVGTVPEMKVPAKSPSKIMQAVLEHEQKVTEQIHMMMCMACDNHDHASEIFLQWFITEQTEELNSVEHLVNRLAISEDGAGLLLIDSELKSRA